MGETATQRYPFYHFYRNISKVSLILLRFLILRAIESHNANGAIRLIKVAKKSLYTDQLVNLLEAVLIKSFDKLKLNQALDITKAICNTPNTGPDQVITPQVESSFSFATKRAIVEKEISLGIMNKAQIDFTNNVLTKWNQYIDSSLLARIKILFGLVFDSEYIAKQKVKALSKSLLFSPDTLKIIQHFNTSAQINTLNSIKSISIGITLDWICKAAHLAPTDDTALKLNLDESMMLKGTDVEMAFRLAAKQLMKRNPVVRFISIVKMWISGPVNVWAKTAADIYYNALTPKQKESTNLQHITALMHHSITNYVSIIGNNVISLRTKTPLDICAAVKAEHTEIAERLLNREIAEENVVPKLHKNNNGINVSRHPDALKFTNWKEEGSRINLRQYIAYILNLDSDHSDDKKPTITIPEPGSLYQIDIEKERDITQTFIPERLIPKSAGKPQTTIESNTEISTSQQTLQQYTNTIHTNINTRTETTSVSTNSNTKHHHGQASSYHNDADDKTNSALLYQGLDTSPLISSDFKNWPNSQMNNDELSQFVDDIYVLMSSGLLCLQNDKYQIYGSNNDQGLYFNFSEQAANHLRDIMRKYGYRSIVNYLKDRVPTYNKNTSHVPHSLFHHKYNLCFSDPETGFFVEVREQNKHSCTVTIRSTNKSEQVVSAAINAKDCLPNELVVYSSPVLMDMLNRPLYAPYSTQLQQLSFSAPAFNISLKDISKNTRQITKEYTSTYNAQVHESYNNAKILSGIIQQMIDDGIIRSSDKLKNVLQVDFWLKAMAAPDTILYGLCEDKRTPNKQLKKNLKSQNGRICNRYPAHDKHYMHKILPESQLSQNYSSDDVTQIMQSLNSGSDVQHGGVLQSLNGMCFFAELMLLLTARPEGAKAIENVTEILTMLNGLSVEGFVVEGNLMKVDSIFKLMLFDAFGNDFSAFALLHNHKLIDRISSKKIVEDIRTIFFDKDGNARPEDEIAVHLTLCASCVHGVPESIKNSEDGAWSMVANFVKICDCAELDSNKRLELLYALNKEICDTPQDTSLNKILTLPCLLIEDKINFLRSLDPSVLPGQIQVLIEDPSALDCTATGDKSAKEMPLNFYHKNMCLHSAYSVFPQVIAKDSQRDGKTSIFSLINKLDRCDEDVNQVSYMNSACCNNLAKDDLHEVLYDYLMANKIHNISPDYIYKFFLKMQQGLNILPVKNTESLLGIASTHSASAIMNYSILGRHAYDMMLNPQSDMVFDLERTMYGKDWDKGRRSHQIINMAIAYTKRSLNIGFNDMKKGIADFHIVSAASRHIRGEEGYKNWKASMLYKSVCKNVDPVLLLAANDCVDKDIIISAIAIGIAEAAILRFIACARRSMPSGMYVKLFNQIKTQALDFQESQDYGFDSATMPSEHQITAIIKQDMMYILAKCTTEIHIDANTDIEAVIQKWLSLPASSLIALHGYLVPLCTHDNTVLSLQEIEQLLSIPELQQYDPALASQKRYAIRNMISEHLLNADRTYRNQHTSQTTLSVRPLTTVENSYKQNTHILDADKITDETNEIYQNIEQYSQTWQDTILNQSTPSEPQNVADLPVVAESIMKKAQNISDLQQHKTIVHGQWSQMEKTLREVDEQESELRSLNESKFFSAFQQLFDTKTEQFTNNDQMFARAVAATLVALDRFYGITLTGEQLGAYVNIAQNCRRTGTLDAFLQAPTGFGKSIEITLVTLLALITGWSNCKQVRVVAPTDVLVAGFYKKFRNLALKLDIKTAMLSSDTSQNRLLYNQDKTVIFGTIDQHMADYQTSMVSPSMTAIPFDNAVLITDEYDLSALDGSFFYPNQLSMNTNRNEFDYSIFIAGLKHAYQELDGNESNQDQSTSTDIQKYKDAMKDYFTNNSNVPDDQRSAAKKYLNGISSERLEMLVSDFIYYIYCRKQGVFQLGKNYVVACECKEFIGEKDREDIYRTYYREVTSNEELKMLQEHNAVLSIKTINPINKEIQPNGQFERCASVFLANEHNLPVFAPSMITASNLSTSFIDKYRGRRMNVTATYGHYETEAAELLSPEDYSISVKPLKPNLNHPGTIRAFTEDNKMMHAISQHVIEAYNRGEQVIFVGEYTEDIMRLYQSLLSSQQINQNDMHIIQNNSDSTAEQQLNTISETNSEIIKQGRDLGAAVYLMPSNLMRGVNLISQNAWVITNVQAESRRSLVQIAGRGGRNPNTKYNFAWYIVPDKLQDNQHFETIESTGEIDPAKHNIRDMMYDDMQKKEAKNIQNRLNLMTDDYYLNILLARYKKSIDCLMQYLVKVENEVEEEIQQQNNDWAVKKGVKWLMSYFTSPDSSVGEDSKIVKTRRAIDMSLKVLNRKWREHYDTTYKHITRAPMEQKREVFFDSEQKLIEFLKHQQGVLSRISPEILPPSLTVCSPADLPEPSHKHKTQSEEMVSSDTKEEEQEIKTLAPEEELQTQSPEEELQTQSPEEELQTQGDDKNNLETSPNTDVIVDDVAAATSKQSTKTKQ